MEETEKEREERLKQWENFLEEGEGEGGGRKGEGKEEGGKESTARSTDQLNKVFADFDVILVFLSWIYITFCRRKVVKADTMRDIAKTPCSSSHLRNLTRLTLYYKSITTLLQRNLLSYNHTDFFLNSKTKYVFACLVKTTQQLFSKGKQQPNHVGNKS